MTGISPGKALLIGRAFFFQFIVLLSGCSGVSLLQDPAERAEILAKEGGFQAVSLAAGKFELQTFQRGVNLRTGFLTVYIEGDGSAWKSRYRLSTDPTPRNPMALRLAARDPSRQVLYIARPCQYLDKQSLDGCDSRYWSSHRYAMEVVRAVSEAISKVKESSGATAIGLVGYSGGGVIAALVATQRNDVDWLITVAANLDHASWTELHGITTLRESLNPVDFANQLEQLPQTHLVGGKDRIVPPEVVNSYMEQLNNPQTAKMVVIEDYDHQCCWSDNWPELMCRYQPVGSSICI